MTPREKIAAIFAKARSTTSPHERDNAVTLGTRLAEKAGLSLDLFDVPGRVHAKPERSTVTIHGSYSGADMTAAMMAMTEALKAARFKAEMAAHEEAMRRATDSMRRASEQLRAQQAAYRAGRQDAVCRSCGSRTTHGVRHECPRQRV